MNRIGGQAARLRRGISLTLALAAAAPALAAAVPDGDWRDYGRDPGGTRYSPLRQITPANVAGLTEAWKLDLKPADAASSRLLVSNMTPLAVNGVIYLASPYGRLLALDGDTGQTLWTYMIPDGDQIGGRGLEYWPGDAKSRPRIFLGTRKGLLMAIDPDTGQPVEGFATINLKTPDVMDGFPDAAYAINSAPVIYKDVLITGARVQESPTKGPRGDVRGWDARTGKLLWTFHSIPQPGERFHETWEDDGWKQRSGVNVWNLMSVDAKRGIVYLPFGAPAYDRIGIDRKGANLFSNSLVALDARTGKYLWHYQTVHHDIWDLDAPGQPTLLDIRKGGRTIPAVAVITKQGLLFLLDRVTGKPVYPVKETPVPPSTIPGEQAWPTQPIPSAPPPLTRQSMTADEITDITPEHRQFCLDRIKNEKLSFAVQYEPLRSDHPTVRFPGSGGGANWGGGAFDPANGYYIINTSEMGSVEQMGLDAKGNWYNVGTGPTWWSDNKIKWMCQKGPWGQLIAVDVNSGKIAWQESFGVTDAAPAGKQETGRPNVGGPIITASGLVFIGATDDARFRAYDVKTGKTLWATKLGASAHATPITYTGKSGRQYVATVAAGGSYLGSPATASSFVAFALPQGAR